MDGGDVQEIGAREPNTSSSNSNSSNNNLSNNSSNSSVPALVDEEFLNHYKVHEITQNLAYHGYNHHGYNTHHDFYGYHPNMGKCTAVHLILFITHFLWQSRFLSATCVSFM